jgi:Phytanoyl-CoA dioxygenase (PhyH)
MMFDERFASDGCLVIDRLFDPALIDSVHDEYLRQYGAIDPADPPLHMNVGDGRLHLPITLRGPLLDPSLYAHPLLVRMLSSILDAEFVIDNVSVVTALPGAGDQRFHRDHPPLFPAGHEFGASLPCYAVTVAIPLIDLDEECGTTELFAGSMGAQGNEDTGPQSGLSVLPLVKRGGCFLMDYRIWHRGRANRSARPRPILYIAYSREWFTDIVNFKKHARLVIDRESFETIPVEHRPMFRRAAGRGLVDATIKELQAQPLTHPA